MARNTLINGPRVIKRSPRDSRTKARNFFVYSQLPMSLPLHGVSLTIWKTREVATLTSTKPAESDRVSWPSLSAFLHLGIPALRTAWQSSLFTIYGTNTESATAVVGLPAGAGPGALHGGWAASRWPTRLSSSTGSLNRASACSVSCRADLRLGAYASRRPTWPRPVVAFALVVLPTLLMGTTLPILCLPGRAPWPCRQRRGHPVSVNTLGSAFACVLAAGSSWKRGRAYLPSPHPEFCVWRAILLGRMLQEARMHDGRRRRAASARSLEQAARVAARRRDRYLSLFRDPWFRAYAFLSGGSARDFAHLLAFFLAGTAFGGLAGWPLATRRSCPRSRLCRPRFLPLRGDSPRPWYGAGSLTVPSWVALPLIMLEAGLWAVSSGDRAFVVAPDRDVVPASGSFTSRICGASRRLFTGFVLMDHLATREHLR